MDERSSSALIPSPDSQQEAAAGGDLHEIQRSLDQTRLALAQRFEILEEELERTFDLPGWIQRNPWKAVGVAAAVGFYFGLR